MFSNTDFNDLFKYALALTHDEPKAYDLVQSAVEKVLRKEALKPVAYARVIIRNSFYDEYNYEKKFDANEAAIENSIDLGGDLENLFIVRESLEILLADVGPLDREILYLWGVEDFTFAEISQHTGVKRGTLLSRIHRLRQKIANQEVENEKTP